MRTVIMPEGDAYASPRGSTLLEGSIPRSENDSRGPKAVNWSYVSSGKQGYTEMETYSFVDTDQQASSICSPLRKLVLGLLLALMLIGVTAAAVVLKTSGRLAIDFARHQIFLVPGEAKRAEEGQVHDCMSDDWRTRWSEEKKSYCCETVAVGCSQDPLMQEGPPYDCSALEAQPPSAKAVPEWLQDADPAWRGQLAGESTSPSAMVAWCCKQEGVGCAVAAPEAAAKAPEATAAPQAAHAPEAAATPEAVATPKAGQASEAAAKAPEAATKAPEAAVKALAAAVKAPEAAAAPDAAAATPAAAAPPRLSAPAKDEPSPAKPDAPFDCAAGFLGWEANWSPIQQAFCCRTAGRGCGLTKALELPAASKGASPAYCDVSYPSDFDSVKQDWCCKHHSVGCPLAMIRNLIQTTPAPGAPGCDTECTVRGQTETCRNRIAWAKENMFGGKSDACLLAHTQVLSECACDACTVRDAGCPHSTPAALAPWDCQAGLDSWRDTWPEKKKEWCCDYRGLTCPTPPDAPDAAAETQPLIT